MMNLMKIKVEISQILPILRLYMSRNIHNKNYSKYVILKMFHKRNKKNVSITDFGS